MQFPQSISKYLSKNDSGNWVIETFANKSYNNVIVIPALDECLNIDKLLNSLSLNSDEYLNQTLIVIVVNNLISEKHFIIEENYKLIEYLRARMRNKSNLNIGIIDASSNEKALPLNNGGVGFARKIGMDLALKYFNYGSHKKQLLLSLDADCIVSKNYLEIIINKFNHKNLHAAVINFEHVLPEDNLERSAIINYEIFLRYYVLGLKYANSQFAFPSIGSTIVCDAESYIRVGGMNKKKAGEDFYFLEKLAKIEDIYQIKSATVFPSSRISNRVPFGTGPRIKRFLDNPKNEYSLYSPKSFIVLKKWLSIFSTEEYLRDSKELIHKAKAINSALFNFLVNQNFEESWNKIIQNSKTNSQLTRQKIVWMDGFKTLKLIHYLRDNYFPNENMFDALDELFKKMKIDHSIARKSRVPELNIQKNYLDLLRIHT